MVQLEVEALGKINYYFINILMLFYTIPFYRLCGKNLF
jgi:hypothetical protein